MIFDGHAYCFPSLRGSGGFSDPNQFRKHLQLAISGNHQSVWRVRDGDAGDNEALIDSSNSSELSGVKNSDFHAAENGRFEWTVDGEIYTKQYLPPQIADMSYPPDRLVAEMDYAGVEKALLHRTPYLGIGNDFIADCVKQFPERLMGLAHVEEWLISADPDTSVQKVEKAFLQQGLSGLQFLSPQLNLYGQRGAWDGDGFRPFWDRISELEIPVFFSLKGRIDPKVENYIEELKTLQRWVNRYPDVTVVLTHGLEWPHFIKQDKIMLPEEVWAPFENPNLHLQMLFPISLGTVWDYPMIQIQPTIMECVERLGADRLMWGTDMPMVMRYWSYRQNIDFIRRYCSFLDTEQTDAILGNTSARLMGVES
jgi:predicted TIM-barrel fold metal-dependent hydrolase